MLFLSSLLLHLISHKLLDALRLGAGVVVAVAFHEVDNTPHCETCAEGDNERLKNRDSLIDEPIIRNVLLREYHNLYPSNNKEQKIAELKKKLAELENNK